MGFIDGFEHDVFISYSHVDNEPSFGFEWVTCFQKELQTLIRQKTAKVASIWWDEKLPRNEDFNLKLKSLVESSAMMVVILTQNSIDSDYCGYERDWFFSANNGKPCEGKRVFIVMPDPIAPDEKPEVLRKLLGHSFYITPEGENSCVRATLAESAPRECHYKFSAALAELADAIVCQLKNLKELLDSGQTPVLGPKVFVADVTDDLDSKGNRSALTLSKRDILYSLLSSYTTVARQNFARPLLMSLKKA